MKQLLLFFAAFFFFACLSPIQAQDKKEIKKWKKKMKDMDPLAFKKMYEEHQQLKSQVASKDRELSTLRKEVMSKDAQISAKDTEIAELRAKLEAKEAEMSTVEADDAQDISKYGDDYTKGIVYKVQVGAFTKNTYSEKIDGAFWEEDADGTKKYTIGYFRDYQDATRFKNYMRAIGVSDAWIVAYEDNQRKDIKNILDADSSDDSSGFDD